MFTWLEKWIWGDRTFGAKRSGEWPRVRREYLKAHPNCEICGKRPLLGREVHHKVLFNDRPELELNPTNFLTVCRTHHFEFCHLFNWKRGNDEIDQWIKKIQSRPQT